MCPSVLSRDVGLSSSPAFSRAMFAVPKVPATPVASSGFTPVMKKRVTFAGSPVLASPSPSPFQPRFDRNSFEKHLQEIQVGLVDYTFMIWIYSALRVTSPITLLQFMQNPGTVHACTFKLCVV